MQWIITFAVLSVVVAMICLTSDYDFKKFISNPYFILFALGFLFRIIAVFLFPSLQGDVTTLKQLATTIGKTDFRHFYETHDLNAFPPLTVAILYFIGFLNTIFKFNPDGSLLLFLMKLPGIVGDMGIGFFTLPYCL